MKRLTCDKTPKAIGPYSVATQLENLIFTSGQLPINPDTGKIDKNDIQWQTTQSLTNVKSILEENNSSMDNIIKTTVFLNNISDFNACNDIYKTFFSEGNYPSRTALEVSELPMNALVEIEVIATTN